MRAAIISESGGPEVFRIKDIEDPVIGPEDVLVDVKATALNRADLLQRRGRYNGPRGTRDDLPGLEMAGIVASVGERVYDVVPGDRVFGLLGGGGYALRVATHHRMVSTIPDHMSFTDAAAVPEVFITAYDALFNQCKLSMGDTVLIHAAGSGVGTAAIQLAHCAGAMTFGTASSAEKLSKAADIGLDVGINYQEQDFAEVVKEQTYGRGVDVILDVIGASYWDRNLACLVLRGRMVIVGTMSGATLETNLGVLMGKRLQVRGTTLRARPLEEKIFLAQQFNNHVLPLLEDHRARPVVDRVFPLEQVSDAHIYMESNANFGKIVLSME